MLTSLSGLCVFTVSWSFAISPLVPFNLLNYYVGGSYRFDFKHFAVGFLFTAPMSFCWVGVGGAILKYRLINDGLAEDDKYLPFIWSGFSVAIFLLVLSSSPIML